MQLPDACVKRLAFAKSFAQRTNDFRMLSLEIPENASWDRARLRLRLFGRAALVLVFAIPRCFLGKAGKPFSDRLEGATARDSVPLVWDPPLMPQYRNMHAVKRAICIPIREDSPG